MVEINSKDYHDFVIKNGKLIAEFEQMYQKSEEVPWHQDKQEKWLDIRILIELIRDYGTYDEITDFGCGYGYFLNQIGNIVGNKEVKLYGYDVSETACDKGKILFPHISFKKLDLMSECHTQYVRREEKRREEVYFC